MHRILRGIVYLLLMTFVSCVCMAQVATGPYPFGTFDTKGFDTVNVGNLNVHFSLPVLNKPGRGVPFTYALSYDSSVWYPSAVSGSTVWTPVQAFGWRGDTEIATGYISFSQTTQTRGAGTSACTLTTYFNFIYHDPFGSQHPFIGKTIQVGNTGGNCTQQPITSFSYLTKDGSGYTLAVTNYTTAILTSALGAQISPPINVASGASTFTDSNGNQIKSDGAGHFTDTTGNVALTVAGVAPSNHTFTYKDTGGISRAVQMTYAAYTVETAFGCSGVIEYGPVSTYLVDSVSYPDGSIYHFSYEPTPSPGGAGHVTGRLSGVQLPQGGWIQYSYTSNGTGESHGLICADGSASGLTRILAADSGSAASNWTYTRVAGTGTSHTDIVDGLSNQLAYDFVLGVDSTTGTPAAYYETNRTVYQGPATAPAVLARQTCYNGAASPCTTTALTFPVSQIDVLETLDAVKTYGVTNKYNSYGARTELDVYDFGSTATVKGSLLRKDTWTYANPSVVLPSAYNAYDGVGTMAAWTKYGYDQTTPSSSTGIPQHVAVTGARSNLTSVTQYSNASTSYLTNLTYKDTGSLLTTAGPNGTTTLSYDPTYVYSTGVAYPTPSSSIPISTSAGYDVSYSGMISSTVDPNNQKTGFLYDSMLRTSELDFPDGGMTKFTFTPNQVSQNTYQYATVSTDTEIQYDGYGRLSRVARVKDSSGTTWYQQDSCYDGNGNLSFSSYTYQGTGLSASKVCSASASDGYTYDVLGRLKIVSRKGVESLSYVYAGRATQSTDENNVKHITQVDGLGRTAVACEISSNSSMPPSGSPAPASCGTDYPGTGFITTYAYDVANHKTTITQGVQTRIFQTDWLGRTISIQEPEMFAQGQIGAAQGVTSYSYAYNATGLVVTRSKPKANQATATVLTTTTTHYDTLGRVISISYNDGTPTKTFAYDASAGISGFTQNYLKGRLSLASVAGTIGATTAYSYDQVGRTTDLNECLPSVCGTTSSNKTLHYGYDLAGNMTSSTDGNGVTTGYTVSRANELQTMTSSSSPTNVISTMVSGPNGPVSYSLGNGLSNVYGYDSLGRISGGWVCNGSTSASCTGGTMLYGFTDGWNGSQLQGSSDSALDQSSSYGYDEFNRLTSRTVNSGTVQNLTYAYDRYGNRWQQTASPSGPQPSYSFNTSTNQITGTGYVYDAAGNMTQDGGTGVHTYTYDAEGNITKVDNGSTASYTYNALNQRVHTSVTLAGITTVTDFLFNVAGQRVSLWDGTTHAATRGQYYWGGTGKPIAYYSGGSAHFQHQDWLGTERLRTTSTGALESSFTSLPFGDAKSSSGTDGDPYHFAVLDNDSESNTDHAQYRQYSDTQGRWMRPDPYFNSYSFGDPQSLNRYVYALNNPVAFTDRLGLDTACYTTKFYVDEQLDSTETICIYFGDGGGGGNNGSGNGGGGGGPAPNNGRNCSAGPASAGQYVAATAEVATLTSQWASGLGSGDRTFGPGTSTSAVMGQSAGVQEVLGAYYMTGQTSGLYTFGASGAYVAGGNPVAQFVGSFRWSISGGVLSLTNTTSLRSLTYDHGPQYQRGSLPTPGGNTHQTYQIGVVCH